MIQKRNFFEIEWRVMTVGSITLNPALQKFSFLDRDLKRSHNFFSLLSGFVAVSSVFENNENIRNKNM